MKRILSLSLIVALLAAAVLTGAGCRRKAPVVLGLVAVEGITNMSRSATSVAQAMQGVLGREVIPRVYMSYGQLVEGLGSGQCDTAIVPGFAYAVASDRYGARVILSTALDSVSELKFEWLTRPDTGVLYPAQMSGKKTAVAAAEGTSAQQYALSILAEAGAAQQAVNAGDDQAALAMLLGRSVDAALVSYGFRDTARATIPDIDTRIVVVSVSARIPLDAVVVTKSPAAPATEISEAWTSVASQVSLRNTMRELFSADGFIPVTDQDYAQARKAVAALGIKIR